MVNLFNDSLNSSLPTKTFGLNYLSIAIIVIVIVAILIYVFYKPKAEDVTVLGPFQLEGTSTVAKKDSIKTLFTQSQVNSSLGNNFTLSFFVYMDDANRERIPVGSPNGEFRFKTFLNIIGFGGIILDPIHQSARLSIRALNTSTPSYSSIVNIDIPNFMIARWNNLTFTLEGRSVDVYVNGALVKSALLDNVPLLYPVGVLLETSPDFSGQCGLFQAWPRRLTESEVIRNYKRNTDTRGKPYLPDISPDVWGVFKSSFCDIFGLCGVKVSASPTQYIDYEFA